MSNAQNNTNNSVNNNATSDNSVNNANGNNNGKIRRAYGKERVFADILFNPETKSVFARIDLGAFSLSLSFFLRSDKKTYDLYKSYVAKDGSLNLIKLGQTFSVTRRDGSEVEGVSKATLGLYREYDKELKKELTKSNDALFITIVKLKEPKPLGESGLKKVGFISGVFGIELADENANKSDGNVAKDGDNAKGNQSANGEQPIDHANDYVPIDENAPAIYDDEEIPF